jgi:hypothetical protein
MILVDTSIWIDHLHATEPRLVELLGVDQVGCYALVVEEMALGSIVQRDVVLDLLAKVGGAQLWTRDKRLQSACADTNVQLFEG